ncbi:MAG TPA: hypothetical protein VGX51_11655 [Solirubrobacteraceae bacterium]|nr:hypothetical protein [Solirubrobacteraceae bacterium]
MPRFSVLMRHAATAVVVLAWACAAATTAQATVKRRSVAHCHKHTAAVHGQVRCRHRRSPAHELLVRELVWEVPVQGNARPRGEVRELVTEGQPAAGGPAGAEAKKEAEEEAQEAREEAAEAAKERAEEAS